MLGPSYLPASAGGGARLHSAFLLRVLATVSILVSVSCDSAPTDPANTLDPEFAKGGISKDVLVVAGGDGQTAPAGTELPQPLVVRVESAAGDPVAGVTIDWAVKLGGGSLSATQSVTDDQGEAGTRLTLGSATGLNEVSARGRRLREVRLTATATDSGGGGDPGGGGSGDSFTVTVTPGSAAIEVDQTVGLSADIVNQNGDPVDTASVEWATLDASVASVSASGLVTGKAEGTARIAASYGDGADTATVTVSEPASPPPGGDSRDPFRAFPEAEGYGAMALTSCSRSSVEVLRVTNLKDSGAGSLRQAVADATNGVLSVIVFDVAGIIYMDTAIELRNVDCLYVAGQTAPGGGITISSSRQVFYTKANTHDVVIRYLRLRGGYHGDRGGHSNIIIGAGWDILLDHLSASWTTDKPLTIYKSETAWSRPISQVTVQNSIVSEAFADQPTGMQITGQDNNGATEWRNLTDISIHRNLFAHNSHRNPNVNTLGTQLINNVVYNWLQGALQTTKESKADVVNNYFKAGPMTHPWHEWEVTWDCANHLGYTPSLYVVGNVGPHNATGGGDQWSGSTRVVACYYTTGETIGEALPTSYRRTSPLPTPAVPVSTQGAVQAYNALMGHVGASSRLRCDGDWAGARDAVDTRVVNDVINGTGSGNPLAHEDDVGGFPNIAAGSACSDGDGDGMPDAFETRYSLNPGSAADALEDSDNDQYTNLEEYLNGTKPR